MPNAALAIAAKEFRENVHSRRFQIALALATLLLVTSVITLGITYHEDQAAFEAAQADLERGQSFGGFNVVAAEVNDVVKRPNALSVFTGGPGDTFRRTAEVAPSAGVVVTGPGGSSGGSPQASGGSSSPTNQRFQPLDLGFVAAVVMTFMAVLFAYDAIVGERERGTLKLMMTNPVPRDQILLGKYLGGMASVLAAFLVSVAVALAVFQFTQVRLSPGEWSRLAVVLLLFVPLCSAFYLLGLFVSSVARRSGTSLLVLLLVWLVLVFGAGNAAAAAAKSADATTDADVLRAFEQIEEERRSRAAPLENEFMHLRPVFGPNATASPDTARFQELQQELRAIAQDAQAARDAVLAQAQRELDGQLSLAENLAAWSPAEAFRNLASKVARSDYWSFKEDREAAELYLREVERARAAWNEEHGGGGMTFVVVGPGGRVEGPADDFEPPEFHHRQASLGEQLQSAGALRDLLVLALYNAFAFLGAYLAFVRADVR
ncbi:MAG TPA: ABC transporter permease subunit [Candidatus Thermoplasmatota archaeon]|nr:ABC transporter permease subunit [Candidatus Thermoplasmatota archaeon]